MNTQASFNTSLNGNLHGNIAPGTNTGPVKVFLSHTSDYQDLAGKFQMALQALEGGRRVEVSNCQSMAGAVEWRKWIEKETREADVFVLIYPHDGMDMGWPNFEVARFLGQNDQREKKVVWIKNRDTEKMPAVFEPYQAYTATPDGIYKFFKEFFADGLLTDNTPVNEKVGQIFDPMYERARDAARQVAGLFENASTRPQYYERRIYMTLAYDDQQRLDPHASMVEGNQEGMKIIELGADRPVSWATVRARLGESVDWPNEIEAQISNFVAGALPAYLAPFSKDSTIYIPVIAKTEMGQSLLRHISVIFVEANEQKLRPMFDWKMPDAMPVQIVTFARLMRLMLRVRYDILEPRCQEVRYQLLPKERCRDICDAISTEYDVIRRDSRKLGIQGIDAFNFIFDPSLKTKIDKASEEYIRGIRALGAYTARVKSESAEECDWSAELADVLNSLRRNNGAWLEISAAQFSLYVNAWR